MIRQLIVLFLGVTVVLSRGVQKADDKKEFPVESNDIQLSQKDNQWSGIDGFTDCKDCKDGRNRDGSATKSHDPVQPNKKQTTKRPHTPRRHVKPFLLFHKIRVNVNNQPGLNSDNSDGNNQKIHDSKSTKVGEEDEILPGDSIKEHVKVAGSTTKLTGSRTDHYVEKDEKLKEASLNKAYTDSVENKEASHKKTGDKVKFSTDLKHDVGLKTSVQGTTKIPRTKDVSNENPLNNKNEDKHLKSSQPDQAVPNTHKTHKLSKKTTRQPVLSKQTKAKQATVIIDGEEVVDDDDNDNGEVKTKSNKVEDRQLLEKALKDKTPQEETTRSKIITHSPESSQSKFVQTNREATKKHNQNAKHHKNIPDEQNIRHTRKHTQKRNQTSSHSSASTKYSTSDKTRTQHSTKDAFLILNEPKENVKTKTTTKPTDGDNEVKDDKVDFVIPAKYDDRWSREGLSQVPDVARLEQRLHPTVGKPVNDIIRSLERMFSYMQASLNHVDFNHHDIHNVTRWKYMTGVREQLTSIAEENDKIYGIVMEAALLTKQIYRRAHERRHPINYTYESSPVANLRYKSVKNANAANYELKTSNSIKKTSEEMRDRWNALTDNYIRVQTLVEEKLNARALYDLERRANQTIRVLIRARQSGIIGRNNRYSRVTNGTRPDMADAHYLIDKGLVIVSDTKKILKECKSNVEMIRSKSRGHMPSSASDMPFDDSRMVLWAAADGATMHADELVREAVMTEMKIKPLLKEAAIVLSGQASSSRQKQLQITVGRLKEDIKTLTRVLDQIRMKLGDRRFLQERCDTIEGSGWSGDDDDDDDSLIDCDQFRDYSKEGLIPVVEGSGDDLEGSGELDEVKVDIDITDMNKGVDGSTSVKPNKASGDGVSLEKTKLSTSAPSLTEAVTKSGSSEGIEIIEAEKNDDDDSGFTFTDWFGSFSSLDEPVGGLVIDADGEKGLIASPPEPATLNEAIRQRLYNYSQESKHLLDTALNVQTKGDEVGNTWEKVKSRFAKLENRTSASQAIMSKLKAEKAYFFAVHERVEGVSKDVASKSERIEKQCKAAEENAQKKLKMMEEIYEQNKDKSAGAPDPQSVQEAVQSVSQVRDNVKEIQRLTQVVPDPCVTLERQDRFIRANITELRSKIAQAKLIASYLQMAVTLPDNKVVAHEIDDFFAGDTPLTSRVQMMVQPAVENGQLLTVSYNNTGSVSVLLDENTPKLVQTFDGVEVSNSSDIELSSDTWYSLLLERYATAHRLSIFSKGGTLSADINVASEDAVPNLDVTHMTSLQFGQDDQSSGCIGAVKVNNRLQNLYNSGVNTNGSCSSSGSLHSDDTALVLDGYGFVKYNFGRFRRVRSIDVKFTANSDGLIFNVKNQATYASVLVKDGLLYVHIQHRESKINLASGTSIFGIEQNIQIPVDFGTPREDRVYLNGKAKVLKTSPDIGIDPVEPGTRDGLYIGGISENTSSIAGCIKSIKINEDDIGLHNLVEVKGNISFGACPKLSCVSFLEGSGRIDMKDVEKAGSIHIAVRRGALGDVIQYKKGEKFSVSVSLDSEGGIDIEESLTDYSEHIDAAPGDSDIVVVSLLDRPDDKQVHVTIGETTEEFDYKSSGGGGWLFGGGDDDEEEEESGYTVNIGGADDSDLAFKGDVLQLIIGGSVIPLHEFIASNSLQRCPVTRPQRVHMIKESVHRNYTHFKSLCYGT